MLISSVTVAGPTSSPGATVQVRAQAVGVNPDLSSSATTTIGVRFDDLSVARL